MQLVEQISVEELKEMSVRMYDGLVKAVVDVSKRLVVVDAEMHADEDQFPLEQGSSQEDIWGINLYPDLFGTDDFIEFDSMINLRPASGNRSRGVEDESAQERIKDIVSGAVHA